MSAFGFVVKDNVIECIFFCIGFDEFTRLKSYERPKNIFHSEILVDGTSI